MGLHKGAKDAPGSKRSRDQGARIVKHARDDLKKQLQLMRTMIEPRKQNKDKITTSLNKLPKVIFDKNELENHGKMNLTEPNQPNKKPLQKT